MSNLNDLLKQKNIYGIEGHSQEVKEQTDFLKNIVNDESIKNVMEIGFNAGHSAELFLSSNKNIKLVSFDIGSHHYCEIGKQFIDNTYPNRHTLVIGDSLISVPDYIEKNTIKFDLIFIDGSHKYDTAKGDLLNCKKLAHDKTIVVMDDTVNNKDWRNDVHNEGPTKVWNEAKESNMVKEIGSIDFRYMRGQSWGYYKL